MLAGMLPRLLIVAILLPAIAVSRKAEPLIDVREPMTPPEWALLQRELLRAGSEAVPEARMSCDNSNMEKYAIVIHEEPEGGFWAEVPALPGCYSQGETMEELLENVREAIGGVLEVMRDQGKRPDQNIQILEVAV